MQKFFFCDKVTFAWRHTNICSVLHVACVCVWVILPLTRWAVTQKHVDFCPSVLSAAYEGMRCHGGALYTMVKSAPAVTWLAAWMKERLEGHLLPNRRPPVRVSRLATNIIEDRLGGSGPPFKDVRVIKPKVGHLLAPLGPNFKRVSVSLTWMARFVLESAFV